MSVRSLIVSLLLAFALAGPAAAHAEVSASPVAPGDGFKKVSTLVKLPDFIPGLGVLYVDPATLPVGPFLAYDRDGRLVSTIYMVPLDELEAHKSLGNLSVGSPARGRPVDHVEVHFNAGHPGVDRPHYHVILWYVSPDEAASLK